MNGAPRARGDAIVKEQGRQRMARVARLYDQYVAAIEASDSDESIDIEEDDPRLPQGAAMAEILHQGPGACDPENLRFYARQIRCVSFAPAPGKADGAWRVYVGFHRDGPCSGLEFYVHRSDLEAVWRLP